MATKRAKLKVGAFGRKGSGKAYAVRPELIGSFETDSLDWAAKVDEFIYGAIEEEILHIWNEVHGS